MKDDRRRFLHVVGAAAASIALPACGSALDVTEKGATSGESGGGGGGASGAGGAGAGGAGAGGAGGGGTGGGGCQDPVGVNAGQASSFANDGLHKVSGTSVMIGRDAGGIYAMSSLCTHQFCNMNKSADGTILATGVRCNCHGSKFDLQGNVTVGPAFSPLKHYAVAVACDGTLRVDTKTVVAKTTRLMV